MTDHVHARDCMLQSLREELVGPSPQGVEIDCEPGITFTEPAAAAGPFRQAGSGEEILLRDTPTKRYGVGVLYPIKLVLAPDETTGGPGAEASEGTAGAVGVLTEQARQRMEAVAGRAERRGEDETDDFDLQGANAMHPSTMGVSFLAAFPPGSRLVVEAPRFRHDSPEVPVNGRYVPKQVKVGDRERTWWLRRPVTLRAEFDADLVCSKAGRLEPFVADADGLESMGLRFEAFVRPSGTGRQRLVTVCLVNRKEAKGQAADELCLFQTYFRVTVAAPDGTKCILPYPVAKQVAVRDEDEQSSALLYRGCQTFAVGHGCAADWEAEPGERVAWVNAEVLPTYETKSITPDILRPKGGALQVPMAPLAGLTSPGDGGFAALEEVVQLYAAWIQDRRAEIARLPGELQEVARRHMDECQRALERMRGGLDLIRQDEQALQAFRLANHAILLQQIRGDIPTRAIRHEATGWTFAESYRDPDPLNPPRFKGTWRAFQIAFLLMALRSVADGEIPERETVELIWFPTGGGKTEAYLGLAAFAMFLRRLRDPSDDGVHVLMRYTLRLLTAQQFQRAAGLICAMDYFRDKNPQLGSAPFSIGIWLGGSTTPNTNADARTTLKGLQAGTHDAENLFLLTRCPWCGAQMGPVDYPGRVPRGAPRVAGYEIEGDTVVFRCPEERCHFHKGLPVYVVDEVMYERRPTLVIGTVDKFAMLAWRPEARALFGLLPNGERGWSPPGLIIQDELHLIAGPLGSMVGLFETVLEELCTDRRFGQAVKPKIVCATATIRRYRDQIMALYGRSDAALFPPPGLDAANSFFAQYAQTPDGKYARGRMYVGIHGPGLGSMQTAQVRSFSALLQGPVPFDRAARDPWWTLLIFFNSLRELGTTLTLFQSDIPDYFVALKNRFGIDYKSLRSLRNVMELTSRLRSDEVPNAIRDLMVTTVGDEPVDVCLASNIIEVGVDIDRLSLMAVVGQPKTTAQYIQVTGRVGRRWYERPGLVAMLYSPAKPRDRSHFEKFRSYHERLYAQVEPTSVTPFSPPVLDRALHALMAVYVRQIGGPGEAQTPYPVPEQMLDNLRRLLLPRIKAIDVSEVENFERVFRRRLHQWQTWERTAWGSGFSTDQGELLRAAGAYVPPEEAQLTWPTPMSMRNVDAECQAEISQLYLLNGSDDDA